MAAEDRRKMHVDNSKQLPTVISFCSGYGGIERGLELASIEHRVLAYVEIEAFAIANLVAKMEQGELVPTPIWTDIKTFPADLFRDSVDIITGGYPCQPFSVAGRAQAFDDPRHLFPYILDHVRTIRPAQCFFENVEGHINRGLESVLQDLEGAGYDSTWGIFCAEEVGAPHQRKRIFILANANALRNLQSMALWPTPTLHGNYNRKGASQNSGDGLETAIKKDLWPTPTATERSANPKTEGAWTEQGREELANPDSSLRLNVREQISEQGSWSKVDQLEEMANTINEGSQGGYKGGRIRNGKVSMDTLDVAVQHTDNKDQTSGTLNPTWVEWLMGLPTGWTDLDSWVTELSPKQPPEHGRS